jgi:hypothetical protein
MTGSLINNILSNTKTAIVPVIGMGATELMYTDRKPYTVVEIVDENTIVVQEDKAIRLDNNGMSDCQDYKFESNPEAPKVTLVKKKTSKVPNSRWVRKGSSIKSNAFLIGKRDCYHDFSF